MNILFTVPSLRPDYGGPARSVPSLAESIQGCQGNNVWVYSFDGFVPEACGIGERLLKGDFNAAVESIGHVDLLHDNGIWQPFHHRVALFARHQGIPRVASPRGMLEPWALTQGKWKKRIAWFLYQRRDLNRCGFVHATAPSEVAGLTRLGLQAPVVMIPNGTRLPAETLLRGRFDRVAATERRALFLSRIHPKKGIELLVDAWHRLQPKGWKLSIAGPGDPDYLDSLQRRVQSAGIAGQVTFLGPISDQDKGALYLESDLFILPSYSENFGLVVAEALAHGIPVITTTGCPWEDLQRRHCGWWVEPSVAGIQTALQAATSTPRETLDEMGLRGRRLVAESFDWDAIGTRMLSAYAELLSKCRLNTSAA